MSPPLPVYTVVGVLDGEHNVRVHDRMRAVSPFAALAAVVEDIPRRFAHTSPGSISLIGAAVFAGDLRCAHGGAINGPWGEDRCGACPPPGSAPGQLFTVVAIDPASRAVLTHTGTWGATGLAERDPLFDFFLIASVLPGRASPALVHEHALTPRETTRSERIMAMLRYSPHYLEFLGTEAPMHMPV